MAFAVITDLHANWEASQVVLADIKEQGITEIYCLGDVVGYGPDPGNCTNAVKKHCKYTTKGNHEIGLDFVENRLDIPMGSEGAKTAIYYAHKKLWTTQKEFLRNLPPVIQVKNYLMLHANPAGDLECNVADYLILPKDYADTEGVTLENKLRLIAITDPIATGKINYVFSLMRERNTDICFTGHTHVAGGIAGSREKKYDSEFSLLLASEPLQEQTPQTAMSFEMVLEEDKIYIINPGAVGQPRDRDNRASYVIVDGNTVIWRRLPYDYEKTMRKTRSRMPDMEEEQIFRLKYGKYRKEKEN